MPGSFQSLTTLVNRFLLDSQGVSLLIEGVACLYNPTTFSAAWISSWGNTSAAAFWGHLTLSLVVKLPDHIFW
jgi:hypothetical protein